MLIKVMILMQLGFMIAMGIVLVVYWNKEIDKSFLSLTN